MIEISVFYINLGFYKKKTFKIEPSAMVKPITERNQIKKSILYIDIRLDDVL